LDPATRRAFNYLRGLLEPPVVRGTWEPEITTQAGDLVLGSDATQEGEYVYDPRTGIVTAFGYVDVGSTGYNQGSGVYYVYLPLDVDLRDGIRQTAANGRGTRLGDFGTRRGGSSAALGGTLALSSVWTGGARAYLTLPGGASSYTNITESIPWGSQPANTTYTFHVTYPAVAP
jgi:hypothetical protein